MGRVRSDGWTPKRVLVTGGAGFLGSHLCDRLIASGDHVICLDDFSTGARATVGHLACHDRFELVEHDVTEAFDIEVDEIYNFACPASPIQYQRNPIKTTRTCVLGALHMLDLARKNDARILQASTSEVYGDPVRHPQSEDYWGNVNPIGPRACYDEAKRCAETLFIDFHRQFSVETKIMRIFNTYGPRMHPQDGRVVSNFIVQALRDEPITIYGDGSQTRSFCFVDDMIEGAVRLMGSDRTVIGPINIGNTEELPIRKLAELVIEATGSRSSLIHEALPENDPMRRTPDITRSLEILGWRPTVSIEKGLLMTIEYFKQRLASAAV